MNTNIEVIEIKVQHSIIDEILIVAKTKYEAYRAAVKWCKQNNCVLEYLACENERSRNTEDLRTLYYAKVGTDC